MTITWYGHSCFKIISQGNHLTIITDPFGKEIGLTPPRGSVDIITVSHQHPDHNNIKALADTAFVIDGPGEYEIKGVRIVGCQSYHDQQEGKQRGLNTIYLIEMDKIILCHLGDFGEEQLTNGQLEKIGQVDVLLIPVGGNYTIDDSAAAKIVNQIEPHLIIPMHYQMPGSNLKLAKADEFLKEMGLSKKVPVDKLVLKKKDLLDKEMEVVVMKP